LPVYCHLVDCFYWAFIANNILIQNNVAHGKGNHAPKNVADILKSYGAWYLQGCKRQISGIW